MHKKFTTVKNFNKNIKRKERKKHDERGRADRRAYYKAWRAANPEKVKANNARYWERKAERERKKAGEQNERETVTS